MSRQKNYERGAKGEARIMKRLENIGEVSPSSERYPDAYVKVNGSLYGVECKSVLGVHSGGRMGSAKISSTEIQGMNALIDQDIIPCLIVEIRPRTGSSRSYFFIPWKKVQEKYSKNTPGQMDISFYWILQNGVNLDSWMYLQSMEATG